MSGSDALKLDLSTHADKYAANNLELYISKKVNFIFGKNGSGKTTIADEIVAQFSSQYSVHVFKDFDGVAINERLDAVALGKDNASIQKRIDEVDGEISAISKDIEVPDDGSDNLHTKASDTKKKYYDQNSKIDRFYTSTASFIKGISNPQIASPNYYITALKPEISSAKKLTDEEISAHKDTIKADKKPEMAYTALPTINLEAYIESANDILSASVKKSSVISELDGNPQKQQYAKDGLGIHEHVAGEVCAFCGHEITEERWIQLGNYFNDEVKKLENRISLGLNKIQSELDKLSAVESINKHAYYGKYAEQIDTLNTNIKLRNAEYKAYLEDLKISLEAKLNNLFTKTETLELLTPDTYASVQKEYTELIDNNNQFSKDLTNEQTKAKNALRYHEIQKKLDAFKYTDEKITLATLNELNNAAQDAFRKRLGDLSAKQQERMDLISQTKDEKKISLRINELLKNMGVASFELELVNDDKEGQKGQYQIKGHDGSLRPITALSKGEKNIIAFLYFMFDLERPDGSNKPKIVVLDDPMTSNDDTMQYIMINEIQKYYRSIKSKNYFILLTHNIHFYLNVRPNTAMKYKIKINGNEKEISFYEKYGVWRLFSDSKRSTIRAIENGKNDFRTSYETLWIELLFLYSAAGATPDLMLSPSRKICETYMHFTKKSLETFYGENTSAKKLFDVNQHSIDDLEAELNGKTKDEIKNILESLFKHNGAEEHFNSYWKDHKS
jgi:wobble nucleotide-excising tRNase